MNYFLLLNSVLIFLTLKGEQLGLNLNVANDDNRVLVTGIVLNSASNRASDSRGNICPIMLNDEILEINGVALNVNINFFKIQIAF